MTTRHTDEKEEISIEIEHEWREKKKRYVVQDEKRGRENSRWHEVVPEKIADYDRRERKD